MNTVDVKTMSDAQLIERVEYLVKRERQLVECLIWHLQEIQDRKLYITLGYTSLFECLVKHFKYSESVAYGRISALKVIKAVPTVGEALNKGELNLTTLTLAQTYFKKMDRKSDQPKITADEKFQLIENLKNKSTHEVKQFLAEVSPEMDLPPDQVKFLNPDLAQLHAIVDKEVLKKIEYLKSLISHINISPSFNELLHVALDAAIEKTEKKKGLYDKPKKVSVERKKDELQKASSLMNTPNPPVFSREKMAAHSFHSMAASTNLLNEQELGPTEVSTHSNSVGNSRYISRGIKKIIFRRSQNCCEFVHANGKKCGSKFQPQFDHIKAFSRGGSSSLDNIQLLCRVHNASKGNQ